MHLACDPLALAPDGQLAELALEAVVLDRDGGLAGQRRQRLDRVDGVGALRTRADGQGADGVFAATHRRRQVGADQVGLHEAAEVGAR